MLSRLFDLFKFRASYGLVGSDNSFGKDKNTNGCHLERGRVIPGEIRQLRENWCMSMLPGEKERKLDVGLDMNMIDGRLRFTIDYFRNQRYDQLIASGDIPVIIGQTLPKRSIGKSGEFRF